MNEQCQRERADGVGEAARGTVTREVERALLGRFSATSDPYALAELVRLHMPLVRAVVRRRMRAPLRHDDLVAEGVVGLVEAAGRFDPSYDVRFATYAAHWVHARVQQYVMRFLRIVVPPDTRASRRILGGRRRAEAELARRFGRVPTDEELAHVLGVSRRDLDEVRATFDARDVWMGEDPDASSSFAASLSGPEDDAEARVGDEEERVIRRASLARALETLPPRERCIIERRKLAEDPAPLHVLAREMSLSRERVRQLEVRALGMLRARV